MKSNQERSNECLPPKKRGTSSTLPPERRSPTVTNMSDGQRTDSVTCLAASNDSSIKSHYSSSQPDRLQYKAPTSSEYSSSSLRLVSPLSTTYAPPLSQSAAVHYTQLPPSMFIASSYAAPYAGYISPQLLPPPPPPPQPSLSLSSPATLRGSYQETASATAQFTKQDLHRASAERFSMPPPLTDHIQVSASSRATASPHHHPPSQSVHSHHSVGATVKHVEVSSRCEDGGPRHRELHNGELERGRRFGHESSVSKSGSKSSVETRHPVLPDYSTHEHLGLRTSVMLLPNSHGEHQMAPPRPVPEKQTASGSAQPDKGGIVMGKPVTRPPSSSSTTCSFAFPSTPSADGLKVTVNALSPQTVIQTTHNATEPLSMGIPSTSIYPQPPIIGYITGGGGSSYNTSLQQHLLIPGAQPVIIPVSGGGVPSLQAVTSQSTSSAQSSPFPATLPHAYLATNALKQEALETNSNSVHAAVLPAQLHLPVVPTSPGLTPALVGSDHSASVAPPSIPPYFIKGSIIQLADGELKRVEDLKTEDFIQSAEISSELKIDSSTVERIERSHSSPNFAVVQFSVGEHRTQVSVEVLLEYPFFVFGQGWSSCCPDRSTQLLELPCTKLTVGDVCISLTLKDVKNGSLQKTQLLEPGSNASSPAPLKPPRAVSGAPQSSSESGSRHRQRENGIGLRGSDESGGGGESRVENGDVVCGEGGSVTKGQVASSTEGGSSKTAGSRKRRWSAPEGRKVDKSEEEPPLTLPKPSFVPHEVKVSIEGRSNIGK